MIKRIGLLAVVITVVGAFVYVRSFSAPPQKPPLAQDESVTSVAGNPPATAEQSLPDNTPSPQEAVASTADAGVASPAVPAEQQPAAPVLEPEIREALEKRLNTSSEGLVEETRNGVTSVDLQGRFQTAPVATVDEHGNVQITDYSHLPKTPTKP